MNSETLINAWIKSSSLQASTRKQYKSQVDLFFKHYPGLNIKNILDFLKKGQANKRCYHRKYAVVSLLKYMRGIQMLSLKEYDNYATEIKEIKYKIRDRKEVNTITLQDLEYLITNIPNPMLKLILMIEFDTAARIRAILKLRKTDIRQYHQKKALFMREKGQKTALKIITDQTYQHLKEYVHNVKHKYIFLDNNKSTLKIIDDRYYDLWKELRRESRNILGTEISFHWIRRGAGVYWYNKTGKDIVFVQELLGHESPATTAKYLKLEGEKVRERMKTEKRSW